jgi:hypothetical protein
MPPAASLSHLAPSAIGPSSALDGLQIRHGDAAVLGRYLLLAEADLADMGFALRRVSLAEFRDAVEINFATWGGVAPAFDSEETTVADDDVAVFLAVDANGEPVAACGQRFHDLGARSLTDAVEDLTYMYGERAAAAASRVQVTLSAPMGQHITGRTSFMGALWLSPRVRGSGLSCLIADMSRAYALSQWPYETEVLIGKDKLVRPETFAQYGFSGSQRGYVHIVDGACIYDGHVLWTSADALAGRFAAMVAERSASSNGSRRRDEVAVA